MPSGMESENDAALTPSCSTPRAGQKRPLAIYDPSNAIPQNRKRQRVVDEDAYLAALDAIIKRDFFPDLPRLRLQAEWIEASRQHDLPRLRELYLQASAAGDPSLVSGSGPFETPSGRVTNVHVAANGGAVHDAQGREIDTSITLDKFHNKYVSEDNDSFCTIMEEERARHRKRHAWMFEAEKRAEERRLALQMEGDSASSLIPVTYTAKNPLMYVPDDVPLSEKEAIAEAERPAKVITHENTRVDSEEMKSMRERQLAMAKQSMKDNRSAGVQQPMQSSRQRDLGADKYTLDGEETPSSTGIGVQDPSGKRYDYVCTPSPAPGEEFTPFMTWGGIEGTPQLLEGLGGMTPTPHTKLEGSTTPLRFKVSETPKRDQVAMRLAEAASKKQRQKGAPSPGSALLGSRFTPSSGSFAVPTPRRSNVAALSPAARRLAAAQIKTPSVRADAQLRASYSSSPATHTPHMKKPSTPSLLRRASSTRPSSSSRTDTPLSTPDRAGVVKQVMPKQSSSSSSSSCVPTSSRRTVVVEKSTTSSITDDLLNL